MGKLVLTSSFFVVAMLLLLGLFAPNSAFMLLASSTIGYAYLRVGLLIILAFLMLTEPPRNKFLSFLVIFSSIGIVGWAFNANLNYQMHFLDALVILQVCITACITVLEKDTDTVHSSQKLPELYSSKYIAES